MKVYKGRRCESPGNQDFDSGCSGKRRRHWNAQSVAHTDINFVFTARTLEPKMVTRYFADMVDMAGRP
jgi:hypothetical protein